MNEFEHRIEARFAAEPNILRDIASGDIDKQETAYAYIPKSLSFMQVNNLNVDLGAAHSYKSERQKAKKRLNAFDFLAMESRTFAVHPPELEDGRAVTDLATAYNIAAILSERTDRKGKKTFKRIHEAVEKDIRREYARGIGLLARMLFEKQQ